MTQRQINLLAMYNTVLQYMDDHSTAWATITPIADKKSELAAAINVISSKGVTQQQKTTQGYTSDKNTAMETMIGLAYKIALRIKAFAKKNNNAVLLNTVGYSEHSLEKGPEAEVINRCILIASAAKENVAGLAPYKVSAADIKALNNAIETARPKTAERDSVSSERTAITGSLPQLYANAREMASDLDDLVEGLADDAGFIDGYFAARRINDRGHGKTAETTPAAQPVKA